MLNIPYLLHGRRPGHLPCPGNEPGFNNITLRENSKQLVRLMIYQMNHMCLFNVNKRVFSIM